MHIRTAIVIHSMTVYVILLGILYMLLSVLYIVKPTMYKVKYSIWKYSKLHYIFMYI